VAPREKFHVLFVCIGNSCRSPMAEAVARQLASDIIEPSSAGLAPLGHIAERTIATLSANGHSAGGLFSKRLSPKAIDDADLIVNLSGLAIDCLPGRVKVEEWPVEDPYGAGPATYQRPSSNPCGSPPVAAEAQKIASPVTGSAFAPR